MSNPPSVHEPEGKATGILTGKDPPYAPMGTWNEEGIGNWIRGNMAGVTESGGAEGAVLFALGHLALHQMGAIRGVSEGALDAQTAGYRMRLLVNNWNALMLGIPAPIAPLDEPDPDDLLAAQIPQRRETREQ